MNRDFGRRLLWHGALLFLIGLLTGLAIPVTRNPKMALAAHLEALLNGMFLLILGLAWARLVLSPRLATAAFRLLLYGTYANWAFTLLAAIFGTSGLTPLGGAGFTAAAWQEVLVGAGLVSLSIAMLAGVSILLVGLGGAPAPSPAEEREAVGSGAAGGPGR